MISYFTTYREGTDVIFRKTGGKDGKAELYQLESVDRSFFTPYPKVELDAYFNELKADPAKLSARIKDIVKIGG